MIQFGTGGWRDIIGVDFIEANVKFVAEGIYRLAVEQNKFNKPIVIGYDNRFLSDKAALWMTEVLTSHGIVVWLINQPVPTPLTMHMVQKNNLYWGIEITASHNPYMYNGVKLFVEEGRDAPVELTNRLEVLINTASNISSMPYNKAFEQGLIKLIKTPFTEFVDDILSVLNVNAIKKTGLRILLDPMYGSGYYPLNMILNTSQCVVDAIHTNHDAFFGNLPPAPNKDTITELQRKVVEGNYDLGIALDGDGDRLGIIDKTGRYINANEILVMLYWYLHEYKNWKGPVVKNLATTQMLDVIANSFNEKCYEVPVGFKWISKGIDDHDAVLGGESSGGLTVRGHIHGKDSIYAAALFVEMIAVTGFSATYIIEKLQSQYGQFEMIECNLDVSALKMEEIREKIKNHDININFDNDVVKWTYQDGVKFYFEDNSWVVCRPSGTEPVLRIFAEAHNQELAQSYIDKFKKYFDI